MADGSTVDYGPENKEKYTILVKDEPNLGRPDHEFWFTVVLERLFFCVSFCVSFIPKKIYSFIAYCLVKLTHLSFLH